MVEFLYLLARGVRRVQRPFQRTADALEQRAQALKEAERAEEREALDLILAATGAWRAMSQRISALERAVEPCPGWVNAATGEQYSCSNIRIQGRNCTLSGCGSKSASSPAEGCS